MSVIFSPKRLIAQLYSQNHIRLAVRCSGEQRGQDGVVGGQWVQKVLRQLSLGPVQVFLWWHRLKYHFAECGTVGDF